MTPHHHHAGDDDALAELLDLGAEALRANLDELTGWIASLTTEPPARVLDLGAGTGVGTFALLERFPAATVTALDSSEQMLHRIHEKVAAAGLSERVHLVNADLDRDWPEAPAFDLIWASDSLHHAADPHATLRRAFGALAPGGLLAVIEPESFPTFLGDELEGRLRARVSARRAASHPELGGDWAPKLTAAGFAIVDHRRFDIDLAAPLDAVGLRYAETSLRRDRDRVRDELDDDDLSTWRILLDSPGPDSLAGRADLGVHATRSAWIARRA